MAFVTFFGQRLEKRAEVHSYYHFMRYAIRSNWDRRHDHAESRRVIHAAVSELRKMGK